MTVTSGLFVSSLSRAFSRAKPCETTCCKITKIRKSVRPLSLPLSPPRSRSILFPPLFFSLFSSRFCGCEKRRRICAFVRRAIRKKPFAVAVSSFARVGGSAPRSPCRSSNKRPRVSQHFAFSRTLRSAFACASYSRGRRKNI